ncbi:GTP cyclohydrolase II [bacterium]|nr:GTP cyclohydrolase II [bacterium]
MFDSIEDALKDFSIGKPIIIADDEDRENEGDLICSAQFANADIINFMSKECRGLICIAITKQRAQELQLPQMVQNNTEKLRTAFTLSIDGAEKFGVTTGISAFDRAKTVEIVVNRNSKPEDLRRPGHMFPCTAKDGGVFERKGHTEACVDIARLCGHFPAAVMCEVMLPDGTMARRDNLKDFAKIHNLKFITVEQLINYRIVHDRIVKKEAQAFLPTKFGEFEIFGYRNEFSDVEHIAIVKNDSSDKVPMIRVHSECFTGDVLHSLKCDCNSQLHCAMETINKYGKGAVIYLRNHEGRGIGLVNKIKAYRLQELGQDTVEANISLGFDADMRDYAEAAQIIFDLNFNNFRLISNNPEKINGLKKYGLNIVDLVKIEPEINDYNKIYLETKKTKMHHLF